MRPTNDVSYTEHKKRYDLIGYRRGDKARQTIFFMINQHSNIQHSTFYMNIGRRQVAPFASAQSPGLQLHQTNISLVKAGSREDCIT